MCQIARHALAGGNKLFWRLSNLPKSGQQRHTCCSLRQKRTSIASNFSIEVVPGVLAAGPAINGTAYLLVTCLLPVGFSDCSSAKYKALHAVKALHGLQAPLRDIRDSNIMCISEQNTARLYSYCTPETSFQQELLQTQQLFT